MAEIATDLFAIGQKAGGNKMEGEEGDSAPNLAGMLAQKAPPTVV